MTSGGEWLRVDGEWEFKLMDWLSSGQTERIHTFAKVTDTPINASRIPTRRLSSPSLSQPNATFGLIYCTMVAVPRIITNKTILTGYVIIDEEKVEVFERKIDERNEHFSTICTCCQSRFRRLLPLLAAEGILLFRVDIETLTKLE